MEEKKLDRNEETEQKMATSKDQIRQNVSIFLLWSEKQIVHPAFEIKSKIPKSHNS